MGAAISPATASATAARPQPTASTLLVLMPDSSADGAFTATARIASIGRLPLLGTLDLVDGGPVGEPGGNSAFRLAGVWDRLAVGPELGGRLEGLSGPVLLVDDLVDSRWSLTVAGRALRRAGAPGVLPLALAVEG